MTTITLKPMQTDDSVVGQALKDIMLVLGATIFLALYAHIKIILPCLTIVPITGQTFGVILAGALLGRRRASLACMAYLVEGAMGLPVFAAGIGLPYLLGPAGGYLFCMLPAAYIVGYISEKNLQSKARLFTSLVLGSFCITVGGTLSLIPWLGVSKAFLVGLLPYLAGDLFKVFVAFTLINSHRRYVERLR